MKKPTLAVLALVAAAFTTHTSQAAQDNSALLDLLVKKKVITAKEADNVSAELDKDAAQSSADKIKLSSSITELKLSGDLRLRYQYDQRDLQVPSATTGAVQPGALDDKQQRSRARFRLRLNADVALANNWFAGVQLSTSPNSDSGNQTFENGFNKYGIYISKAFLGWKPADWLTLIGGKQANPFYTTDMVWDPDITPDGFVETIAFHKMGFGGEDSSAGYSKNGKDYKAPSAPSSPWELSLVSGQFIYDDNNENLIDSDKKTEAWLFEEQLIASYKFGGGVKATIAPAAMFFTAASLSGLLNENAFTDVAGVSGETRKMLVLTAPGDVSFKLAGLPVKAYWDFAYNTQGKGRFNDIYMLNIPSTSAVNHPVHSARDDIAWLAGIQFGELKKAGDWTLNANWRQSGVTSVDPNLNDSDFALGELNTQGLKTGLFYNLTDATSIGAQYYYAWNLRRNLTGGQATSGAAIADGNNIQVFQFDIQTKF